MSNPSFINDQDMLYKRWEMASFGVKAGREQVEKTVQPVLNAVPVYAPPDPVRSQDKEQFASMLQQFSGALERTDEVIAQEILSLAGDIAQAMLCAKLAIDETVVLPVVKEAVSRLPHQAEGLTLKVNPEDVRLIHEHLEAEITEHRWQVVGDIKIERGGCMVETKASLIDATNNTRWKQIAEALALQKGWMGE